jgi:hypothetical protein
VIRRIVVLVALWCGPPSCDASVLGFYPCDAPCVEGQPGWGCQVPCDAEARCPGTCAPAAPSGFDGPALLWMGPAGAAPPCPDSAPQIVYEGYADFDGSFDCPPCECSAPACVLPEELEASSSAMCRGPDFTSFRAPDVWDGACSSPMGGSATLVSSLKIGAPSVSSCAPIVPEVQPVTGAELPWRRFARACGGEGVPDTCEPGRVCVPALPPEPDGFTQCIMYLGKGSPECPDTYPEERIIHDGFDDDRRCSACACGAPSGSSCSAVLSVYGDIGCTRLLGSTSIALSEPSCLGGAGLLFGGMAATWQTAQPGACAPSGGAPLGAVTTTASSIFCCRAPPEHTGR